MQNMILATPVLSDQAVLTTSTAPAGLPSMNLQNKSIKQVWRSLDAANAFIEIDLPSGKGINLVALLGHTGSSRSYARIRGAAVKANLLTAPGYDSGLIPARAHQTGYDAAWSASVGDEEKGALETNHLIHLMTGYDFAYWRIDITDPLAEWFDAGRLYVSSAWQPSTNMEYGAQAGIIDPSRIGITAAGRISPNEKPKRRTGGFKLSFNTEQEMWDSAFDLEWSQGVTRDVLFIPYPDSQAYLQKQVIYGRMSALSPIIHSTYSIYEKQFQIEEITA